jgi:predicted transport protein
MSDIKLFRYGQHGVSELEGKAAMVEKQLQTMIEQQMSAFLGVRFLASEYTTGKTHKGRIDSLGIDENGCPVIIEYKRYSNENVINQGLFYLDWLLDHQAEFRWLVMETLGKEVADSIEWLGTRLLCIAGDFTRYDQHAVQQINRNVELIRYKLFGGDLLMLELVNVVTADSSVGITRKTVGTLKSTQSESGESCLISTSPTNLSKLNNGPRTHDERLLVADPHLRALYDLVCDYTDNLGDEVQSKKLKYWIAFKKIRNFVCVVIASTQLDPHLKLYLNLSPDTVELSEGRIVDASNKGHWGTGDLELTIRTIADWEQVRSLVERAYQEN